MFNSKQKQLFSVKEKQKRTSAKPASVFVKAAKKKGAETSSGNNALKYSTTGDPFVDQFGKIGTYKVERPFADIAKDCEALWAISPSKCVKMIFYLRMITRSTDYPDYNQGQLKTKEPQRGAELRHEGIMRMIWLSQKDKKTFSKNLVYFPTVGSWKDLITMLQYDLVHHGWEGRVLPWDSFGILILSALAHPATSELMKKYLPQIKAKSACTTVEAQADNMIAKWLCSQLFGSKEIFIHNEMTTKKGGNGEFPNASKYKRYRKLKSSGTAHEWQKLISQKKMQLIDFSKIHGRALSLLVKSKFLKNQGLQEKYTEWIKKPETKEVKYTGFVHELFEDMGKYGSLIKVPEHIRETTNKQFDTLVEKAKSKEGHQTSFIVVRDTSASMSSPATGTTMRCYDVAKALALYFSAFLTGKFEDAWIEFNSDAQMHEWKGKTPLEKWFNDHSSFVGSTNFLSVINLFVQIKKQGVPEDEFPKGILCISDGEFDPSQLNETNVDAARRNLRAANFSEEYVNNFVIVLWNLQNGYYGAGSGEKFETYGDVNNVYYFSGYSASVIAFLTSEVKTASELVDAALNQEVLNLIRLY